MTEFLRAALSAIPAAASSPLALLAYICVIAAWLIIAFRVKRNQNLLTNLKKLPERERARVLEIEMTGAHLASGLQPEQWLRSRIHKYYAVGFLALIAALTIVIVIAIHVTLGREKPGSVGITITPSPLNTPSSPERPQKPSEEPVVVEPPGPQLDKASPSNLSPKPAAIPIAAKLSQTEPPSDNVLILNDYDETGGRQAPAPPEFTLSYVYERQDGRIILRPSMPYLDLLERGGPIAGRWFWWSFFRWQFPRLSIKVSNNTKHTLFLTEAKFEINSSNIDTDPVLVIEENMYNVGHFRIINEGWGPVISPQVLIAIEKVDLYENVDFNIAKPISLPVKTFDAGENLSILPYVPDDLKGEKVVCIVGEIRYQTESGATKNVTFKNRVSLVPPGPGAPAPPTYLYDLFLEAGKAKYTKLVPLQQAIKPGEVDNFEIRIGTNKSASFDMTVQLMSSEGATFPPHAVLLEIFAPRTQSNRSQSRDVAQLK